MTTNTSRTFVTVQGKRIPALFTTVTLPQGGVRWRCSLANGTSAIGDTREEAADLLATHLSAVTPTKE